MVTTRTHTGAVAATVAAAAALLPATLAPAAIIESRTNLAAGADVAVDMIGGPTAVGGLRATFDQIDSGHFVAAYHTQPLAELIERLTSTPPFLTPLTTDGDVQWWELVYLGDYTGSIELDLHYDGTALTPDTDESTLAIYRYSGGAWHELAGTLDTAADTLSITTDHLSPFVLGIAGADLPVPEPTTAALTTLAASALILRRRQTEL